MGPPDGDPPARVAGAGVNAGRGAGALGAGAFSVLCAVSAGCPARAPEGAVPNVPAEQPPVGATVHPDPGRTTAPPATPDTTEAHTGPDHPPIRPAPSPEPAMTLEEHLGLPTDLHDTPALWESRTDTADGRPPTVRRLYPDGRLFTLGTTVVGLDPNGRPATVTAERRWRQVSLVGDIPAVEAAIREAFLTTPDADPTLRVSDGHETTWTATLPDGTRHEVARRGAAPPAIRTVETAIARGTVKGAVPLPRLP